MKYHITPDGPRECTAKQRACPYSEEPHYKNIDEANAIYSKVMVNTHGSFKSYSKITILSTVKPLVGGRYFGCSIDNDAMIGFREQLYSLVGRDKARQLEANKLARDRKEEYHLTCVTPPEVKKLSKAGIVLDNIPTSSKIELLGIGTVKSGENQAWYVICRAPEIDSWRAQYGFPPKDFHVTLGFEPKDVYDSYKGIETIIS